MAVETQSQAESRELDAEVARRVLDAVDTSRDGLVAFLQRLLAFRTESPNPEASHFLDQADACRAFLAEQLSGDGFDLRQWDAQAASFPRHPVLAGRLAGRGGGRSIALNGHFDVVPAGDLAAWSHDPWGTELVDGRLYGRGAVDMKGGIAAMLWAVHCLRQAGVELRGDVWAHLVSDEEVVGFGSRECVAQLPAVDAAIDPEPSNMAITPATGGLEHLRIEVEGLSAHAGVRYRSVHAGGERGGGVNAIEKMVKLMVGLQELEREWANTRSHPLLPPGFNTLMPGIIVGGNGGGQDGRLNMVTSPGTAPDYCSLEYNVWYYPGERVEDVKRDLEEHVLAVAHTDPWLREHPPRFTWALRGISFPAAATDAQHPVVKTMAAAAAAAGLPVAIEGATYVTDLSWYQAAGIPGVIFAPGSITQAHAPDEYVVVDKLLGATRALALMLLAWCGPA
jgi:acetylornithine deacetylase/succinyl-diaminopimelate desuccinylase family protein